MNRLLKVLVLATALCSTAAVQAHHSFAANFSSDKKTTVDGVVTEFSFKNPHVLIHFDVANADGSTTSWVSEGGAATLLRRAGWPNDALVPGDRIRVSGDASNDGSPMVSMSSVDILNKQSGAVMASLSSAGYQDASGAGSQPEVTQKAAAMPLKLADGRPNLTGAWTNHGMSDGRPQLPKPVFNAAGLALQAAFDLTNDPQVFCDPPGLVRQVGLTPHPIKITQYDDRVVFDYEEYGGHREVYFDNSHAKGIKTHFGDSVARYEGDKLIIETTNLLANQISPEGNRLSDQTTTKEIYSRTDTAEYGPIVYLEMTISDPVYLAEDLVMTRRKMSAGADYQFIENDCHAPLRERDSVNPAMNFFLTSVGVGDGANLGGLAGADAHCEALAASVGQGDKNWVAYLSTTGPNGVNARDRIGSGPFYNAKGEPVAISLADMHNDPAGWMKSTIVTERGQTVNGRGDDPNRHDILTGSQLDGTAYQSDTDTTCSNWTSNSADGSARVGHFDRQGGGENPTSWISAHASQGCSQENLQATGGDALFYCFATGN